MQYSHTLAKFAAELQYTQIPTPVIERCKALFLDTLGSMYAGSSARAVQTIKNIALSQGGQFLVEKTNHQASLFLPLSKQGTHSPSYAKADSLCPATTIPANNLQGKSQIIPSGELTTPYWAAMVNAAAAHMVEQDDLHNSSVFHPACVVFPPALAVAQAINASFQEFITACVVGYEVGIRVGEFLGRTHYQIFHTTATAGTLAAAATVGRLLQLDAQQMQHAFGSAGTQAAGLWEFLKTAADSKQLHTAKAAANGLMAALLAQQGFTGAQAIFEGEKGMGNAFSKAPDFSKLIDCLGQRWALLETSFKYHASCRHTHPAADALLAIMQQHQLTAEQIQSVTAYVHQAAIDVLGAVDTPQTVHQSKFSMGTVLGIVAHHGFAGLEAFDQALHDDKIASFRQKVHMQLDTEVDNAYPNKWLGKVSVQTTDGQIFSGFITDPKGDPDNTLSQTELEQKVRRLVQYQGIANESDAQTLIQWVNDLK